jgi:hypothetical protein
LLKEIGRAAYKNQLICFNKLNREYNNSTNDYERRKKSMAERMRQSLFDKQVQDIEESSLAVANRKMLRIDQCPVCGTQSLFIFEDMVDVVDENGHECTANVLLGIECHYCTFSPGKGIENPSEYGYENIKNFW